MGMAAILFSGVGPFKQIINTFLTEGPIWNLVGPFKQIINTFLTEGPIWNLVKIAQAGDVQNISQHFPILMYSVHTNVWGRKNCPCRKKVKHKHHFSNFGRSPIPDNLCKD